MTERIERHILTIVLKKPVASLINPGSGKRCIGGCNKTTHGA